MTRFTKVLALAAAVLTLPSIASALGVQIVGVSGDGAGQWTPDYVFESDYELMPLNELEAHIQTKKHLPGIPT